MSSIIVSATLTSTSVAASPTLTGTPSGSASGGKSSLTPESGPAEVDTALPYPNPNPASIYAKMLGPCDSIHIVVYSRAMTALCKVDGPGCSGPGWVSVPLSSEALLLPNGIYYYSIQGIRSGSQPQDPFRGKLSFIR